MYVKIVGSLRVGTEQLDLLSDNRTVDGPDARYVPSIILFGPLFHLRNGKCVEGLTLRGFKASFQ